MFIKILVGGDRAHASKNDIYDGDQKMKRLKHCPLSRVTRVNLKRLSKKEILKGIQNCD